MHITTERANKTSRYTTSPQPRSEGTKVPSTVLVAVVSAMMTPVM